MGPNLYRISFRAPRNSPSKSAPSAASLGHSLLNGLLGCGPLVAQVHQRGEHVVHGRSLHGRRHRGDSKVVQLVFEFDHQALGQLLPTPGMRVIVRMICPRMACTVALEEQPAQHLLTASLGPTPLTVISRSKSRFSSRSRNPNSAI